jgi:hypothetical protein
MTTATATDSREQVKADLCNYLTNTANVSDREILKKAVTVVKKAADEYDTDFCYLRILHLAITDF